MQIGPSVPLPALLALVPPARTTWPLNQLLTLEVIGTRANNYIVAKINGETMTARSDVPVTKGDALAVRVVSQHPTTVLKVVDAPPATASDRVAQTLARALPLQQPLDRTIGHLIRLRPPSSTPGGGPARQLASAVERVIGALPRIADVTQGARLQVFVERALVPVEAKLLHAPPARVAAQLEVDVRWQLLQVKQSVRAVQAESASSNSSPRSLQLHQAPSAGTATVMPRNDAGPTAPSLRDEAAAAMLANVKTAVEGALARFQTNHASSSPLPATMPIPLTVELPILREQDVDLLHLQFERESENDADVGDTSTVHVLLRLADTVEFVARIQLVGDKLNMRLWSSDAVMNRAMASQLDALSANVERHGVAVGSVALSAININDTPKIPFRHLVDARV